MSLIFSKLGYAGRLGNQLWQIASSIGVAESTGQEIRFPAWEYAPYFCVPPRYFVDPSELKGAEAYEDLLYMRRGERIFMQDYSLFAGIEDRIRAYFQPSSIALEELAKRGGLDEFEGTLALHIRRGDLVSQSLFPPPVSLNYYQRAALLHPDLPIVVFSDDIPWCRDVLPQALPGRQLSYCEGPLRPSPNEWEAYRTSAPLDWIDLQRMARCSQHIISNSSFSWWAAFLAGNRAAIYPSHWYGPEPAWPRFRLMIPPGWREVPNLPKDLDRRTRSFAYLRAFNRLPPQLSARWLMGPIRLTQALIADPLNTLRFLTTRCLSRIEGRARSIKRIVRM